VSLSLPVNIEQGIIRAALPTDIEAIRKIYIPYIANSAVSFETEIPTTLEFEERIKKVMHTHPFLVFEDLHGSVKGYAYVGAYRERKAYRWCVESSIYIDEAYFGKGVAEKLYTCLIDICKEKGYTRIYGVIALPNERSEAFHRKLGFKQFALFEKTGFKLGKWWDVAWYQLVLDGSGNPPKG
jgi:L-amino acid N-acyltransferase YncA